MIRTAASLCVCLAFGAAAQPTLGIGVLCSYALVVGLQSYQENCHPGRGDEAMFLEPLLAKHRWYVATHGDWDAGQLDAFEVEQMAAVADCARDDLREMMDVIFAEPTRLTKGVELQLAQGRKPEWGVCF